MTWLVSQHEEPNDRLLLSRDCATMEEAIALAGEFEDPAFSNRYVRLRTPTWATPALIEELQQLGLVNGEPADGDS